MSEKKSKKGSIVDNSVFKALRIVGIFGFASVIAACAPQSTDVKTDPASKEVKSASLSSVEIADTVLNWWTGDYNNDAQIEFLKKDGVPIWQEGQTENETGQTFGGFLPVHSYYRKVDMPAFGDRVLYLEELTFKKNPYRQRIYTIIHDAEADKTRVKLWYFKDREKYLGAWNDLSMIKDLTPEDMSPLPDNCDLYIEQGDNGRLEMKMPKDACKFGESIFDYQVSIGPDDFWFRDRIVDAESKVVKMTAGMFAYHKLDKVN